jgi:hypothetical protein
MHKGARFDTLYIFASLRLRVFASLRFMFLAISKDIAINPYPLTTPHRVKYYY